MEKIMKEVLLRLPPKSLVRFRCVSKWYCAIIDSRDFIDSHLHTSCRRKLITLRQVEQVDPFPPDGKVRFLKLDAFDFNHQEEEEEELELEQVYWRVNLYLSSKKPLFSHCNGLVVFYLPSHKICVWNPSTKKRWLLPACPFCLASDYDRTSRFGLGYVDDSSIVPACLSDYDTTLRLGFGYDSIADDYKVLLILSSNTSDVFQVWIIGLKKPTSRRWRRVKDDFPYKSDNISFSTLSRDGFADGAMHFLCRNEEQNLITIVAFDVANETFSILTQTQLLGPHHRTLRFDAFEGCLSIRVNPTSSPSGEDQNHHQVVQLYVRSSTNNNNSSCDDWTKLYCVEGHEPELFRNCLSRGRFLGYSDQEQGNKVFLFYGGKIYSYRLNEKTLQQEIQIPHEILDCFLCVESLVSLD